MPADQQYQVPTTADQQNQVPTTEVVQDQQVPPINLQQPPIHHQPSINQQLSLAQQPLVDQQDHMPPVQATRHQRVSAVQQPVHREHIMKLRTRKHFDPDCGTESKKVLRPYKRRHLV